MNPAKTTVAHTRTGDRRRAASAVATRGSGVRTWTEASAATRRQKTTNPRVSKPYASAMSLAVK